MKKRYITPGGSTYDIYTDALRQPHLLIAGATGSGKSVIVNALIHAALLRLPGGPDGARLILIDPKRVELSQWRDMPHTEKYASEPDEMREALDMAMQITEKRFRQLQRQERKKYSGPDLYIIIDEFADLMTTQRKAITPTIQRLAQLGRAARVHLIIATQCPLRQIIQTEIKCNFDSRFGLRTRSAQDSRNIIERAGLERLPRYGQAVYMTPEGESLYNIPMIPDTELARVAAWWTSRRCRPGMLHRAKRWAKKVKKTLDIPHIVRQDIAVRSNKHKLKPPRRS